MPTAYGYVLLPDADGSAESAISECFAVLGADADFTWGGIISDATEDRHLPFHRRPAACKLRQRANRGDLVIVARLGDVMNLTTDLLRFLRSWRTCGVGVYVADVALVVGPVDAPEDDTNELGLIEAIAAIDRDSRRQEYRAVAQWKRFRGKALNGSPHTGSGSPAPEANAAWSPTRRHESWGGKSSVCGTRNN